MRRTAAARALPLVVLLLASGCAVEVQHNLGEQDANDIYVLLSENGIPAKKGREEGGNEPTYVISTAKQDAAQALKLLTEHSLPRPRPASLCDFQKSSSMVPTATQERASFLCALGGDVTIALNRVDGVLEARVVVMIPEANDLASEDKKPLPTASVFIKYRPTQEGRPPLDEDRVRAFTAGVVPDLRKEAVTVLMSEAQPMSLEVPADQRLQEFVGLRMTADSANRFKLMMGVVGLAVLALIGLTGYTILRGLGISLPFLKSSDDEE